MARVVAIEKGHDGRHIREPGDEFDVPDDRLKDGSTWFKPVEREPRKKLTLPGKNQPDPDLS